MFLIKNLSRKRFFIWCKYYRHIFYNISLWYDFLLIIGEEYTDELFTNIQQLTTMKRDNHTPAPSPVPQFATDIPERLQMGVRQCYLKVRKVVQDTIDLKESDLGIIQEGSAYYIVFRTQELMTQILDKAELIQMAIDQGNSVFLQRITVMRSGEASQHKYIPYELWIAKKTKAKK